LLQGQDQRIPIAAVAFGTGAIRKLLERFGQATLPWAGARGAAPQVRIQAGPKRKPHTGGAALA
jgi:hypothetical protein